MRKYILTLVYLLICFQIAVSQPSIQWQRCYGGSNSESFGMMKQLTNGNFVTVGSTASNNGDVSTNHGGTDAWMIIIDSLGNLISQKNFGGSNSEHGGPLIGLSNGKYAFASNTMSNNGDVSGNHAPGLYDAWFVEFDTAGSVIFQKCYGGSNHDLFYHLISCANGAYLICGVTSSNDGDVSGNHSAINFYDAWVVKIDSLGAVEWQKCYGGSYSDAAVKVIPTQDGGYLIGGSTDSDDGDISITYGMSDIWILKIDSIGNLVWRSYG